mmetsp:Transcript_45393/g.82092  ORF Transcript_45393/g.82092 Transcript_45393/m.82092 type:complete len:218 (+) Transcript_45393:73-726(+)
MGPPKAKATHMASRGAAPPIGEALRSRIAAQADAALAAGRDHPMHLLLHEPDSREDKQAMLKVAERLLLERPQPEAMDDKASLEDFVDLAALRRAAEAGDLKALAQIDRRLKDVLDADEQLRLVEGKDLRDPLAKAAMKLYRESFMSLERAGANIDQEAFQAVMRDDAVTLRKLMGQGLDPSVKNAGGHSLLQLAQERGKVECTQALLDAGAIADAS